MSERTDKAPVIQFPKSEVNRLKRKGRVDEVFTVLVIVLVCVGLVCLYSASYADAYYYQEGNTAYYAVRQGIFAVFGLVVMFVASKFDYHKFHYFAIPVLLVALGIMATIKIIPGWWVTLNGARRWINLGFTTFQPSELAKFAAILCAASLATIYGPQKMRTVKYGVIPFFGIIGIIALELYWQRHLSAMIIVGVTVLVIIFIAGTPFKWLGAIGGLGAGGVALYILTKGYAGLRVQAWLHPENFPRKEGYQALQSFMAIGSGGLWGLGLGQSRQKHLYLPMPANDFIFSIICEELGFVGAVLIILLFAALICRGYVIAMRASDRFGTLLAAGITTQIALQVIINFGVVSGLLPVTGASLPFFSYGGTSLVMLLGEMGILLNISKSISETE